MTIPYLSRYLWQCTDFTTVVKEFHFETSRGSVSSYFVWWTPDPQHGPHPFLTLLTPSPGVSRGLWLWFSSRRLRLRVGWQVRSLHRAGSVTLRQVENFPGQFGPMGFIKTCMLVSVYFGPKRWLSYWDEENFPFVCHCCLLRYNNTIQYNIRVV